MKDASRWRKHGERLLREAVVDQITPEGLHLQYSFNYQRMVLDLLLWTVQLAKISHIALHPDIHERTLNACEFISAFVDHKSGHAPNYGSNDGSLIFPLTGCEYGDFRPLLSTAASVLNCSVPFASGLWDEASLWMCSSNATIVEGTATEVEAVRVHAVASPSPNAGFFRLGTANAWAMVRAGHYSRRPFQADQLHVDLWSHGLNLGRDAGTYLYNGEPPWDNGLAGTSVHNTVMVDGCDQMRRAGRFLWVDWAQASGRASSSPHAQYIDRFEGEHNGYKSLGITHRRVVQCLGEGGWVIVDDLLGEGFHEAQLHWLVPDLPHEITSVSPFSAVFTGEPSSFRWSIFSSSSGTAEVIRAGKSANAEFGMDTRFYGWESPTYGELNPAVSLVYKIKAELPSRIVTVILADDEIELQVNNIELTLLREGTCFYQVSLSPQGPV